LFRSWACCPACVPYTAGRATWNAPTRCNCWSRPAPTACTRWPNASSPCTPTNSRNWSRSKPQPDCRPTWTGSRPKPPPMPADRSREDVMSKPFAIRWPRLAATLALCLLAAAPALAAVDEDDLLPVDEAFVLSAKATSADRIALEWKIADGYYLYRHRAKAVATDGSRLGALDLPHGEPHEDEFFGRVETFRGRMAGSVPVEAADGGQVVLKVSYQGCADAGVCYPPQSRTLTVKMPGAAGAVGAAEAANAPAGTSEKQRLAASAAPTGGTGDAGFAALGKSLGQPRGGNPLAGDAGSLPLPPEQAFGFDAIADGGNALLLRFTPAPGYYLYRDNTTLALDADGIALDAPRGPQGRLHRDEHFGEVVVYFDQVEVPLPLRRTNAGAQKITLTATFQGCQDDGICYPPMTRTVAVSLPAGVAGNAAADGNPIPSPALPLKGREQQPATGESSAAAPGLKPSPSRGGLGGDGFPDSSDAATGATASDAELAEDTR